MPDAFFQSERKRKRPSTSSRGRGGDRNTSRGRGRGGARPQRQRDNDEDLSSEADAADLDNLDFRAGREDKAPSDDEVVDEDETAAEKRVRLAKGYLQKVRDQLEAEKDEQDYDAAEIDRELIASRLQKDVSEAEGRIQNYLAAHLTNPQYRLLTTPSQLPTSATMTPTSFFVSTKRGHIIRYALPSLRKEGKPFGQARLSGPKTDALQGGHRGEILCLAASEDGKYLVSGGRDKLVGVWNVEGEEAVWVNAIRGHKDAVSSIAIPPLNNPSHHILTASLSRHLALASISTLSNIDSFFGHQDSITSISSLKPTVAVTAGSRDRTCRWWRVEEEVQLVFRGGGRTFEGRLGLAPEKPKERLGGGYLPGEEPEVEEKKVDRKGKGREFVEGSIDCVCMLDDQHFVSGGDSGSIALWQTGKKKPIFTHALAHGIDELLPESEDHSMKGARWITSLTALRGSDLFASGSWDGVIRLWSLDPSFRSFKPAAVHSIPIHGFINSLQLLSVPPSSIEGTEWQEPVKDINGTAKTEILLVAAVSQEPRLGRWMTMKKGVKNGVLVAHLPLEQEQEGRALL